MTYSTGSYGTTLYGGGGGTSAPTVTGTATITVTAALTASGLHGPANDAFAYASALNPAGGSGTQDMTNATASLPDGNPDVWFTVTAAGPATVTVTATQISGEPLLEAYDGTDPADLDLLAGPEASVSFAAAAGLTYPIRMWALSTPAAVDYTWTVADRPAQFTLVVPDTEVDRTPTSIQASVTNATPGGDVSFAILGSTADPYVATADPDTGVLADEAVDLPSLLAGTYTLTATDVTTGATASVDITVDNDPLDAPIVFDPDAPVTSVASVPVQRWVVQDPGQADYVFPYNPAEMTSPFPDRTLNTEATVAPYGQTITFEGAFKPYRWTFKGLTLDGSFIGQMAYYVNTNRRRYLVDHRRRVWVVTFENLDAKPLIKNNEIWAHDYSVDCLIHGTKELP